MKPLFHFNIFLILLLATACSAKHPAWLNNYYRYSKGSLNVPKDKIYTLGSTPADTILQTDKLQGVELLIATSPYPGFVPEKIKALHSLRSLDLFLETGGYIPKVIFDMPQLVSLNFDKAECSFAIDTLLPHFTKLSNLELLGLNHFHLEEVPAPITKLKKLKYLNLGGNNISNISGIDKLDSLTSLDLSDNKLDTLPTELNNLHFLEFLNLSYNPNLHITKEFAEQLNKNLPYLKEIWIFETRISVEEGEELEKIFKNRIIFAMEE